MSRTLRTAERQDPSRKRAVAWSVTLHAIGIAGALGTGAAALQQAHWSGSEAVVAHAPVWADPLAPCREPVPLPPAAVAFEPGDPEPTLGDPPPVIEERGEPEPDAPPTAVNRERRAAAAADLLARVIRATPPAEAREQPPPVEAAIVAPPSTASAAVQPSPIASANQAPEYPFVAWRRGIEGTVTLILEVDASGGVSAAHVETSSGSSQLDDAALTRLRTWRFEPARRGEHAVRGTWRQVVVFRLAN